MILSLQLQQKCMKQRQPLSITFTDLTKAFDLVSREGLHTRSFTISCPSKKTFKEDFQEVVFDNST